nr:hypothetical protein CFP56_28579 [Quercus suber]
MVSETSWCSAVSARHLVGAINPPKLDYRSPARRRYLPHNSERDAPMRRLPDSSGADAGARVAPAASRSGGDTVEEVQYLDLEAAGRGMALTSASDPFPCGKVGILGLRQCRPLCEGTAPISTKHQTGELRRGSCWSPGKLAWPVSASALRGTRGTRGANEALAGLTPWGSSSRPSRIGPFWLRSGARAVRKILCGPDTSHASPSHSTGWEREQPARLNMSHIMSVAAMSNLSQREMQVMSQLHAQHLQVVGMLGERGPVRAIGAAAGGPTVQYHPSNTTRCPRVSLDPLRSRSLPHLAAPVGRQLARSARMVAPPRRTSSTRENHRKRGELPCLRGTTSSSRIRHVMFADACMHARSTVRYLIAQGTDAVHNCPLRAFRGGAPPPPSALLASLVDGPPSSALWSRGTHHSGCSAARGHVRFDRAGR